MKFDPPLLLVGVNTGWVGRVGGKNSTQPNIVGLKKFEPVNP